MGLRTYDDPPTVAEVELRRLRLRRRLILAAIVVIVLLVRRLQMTENKEVLNVEF